MSLFFATRRTGDIGLAMFLNAGDPPLDVLEDLVFLLDTCRVDCLELAVPFPNSASDGPVILRSARRALDNGANLETVLTFVNKVRPQLSHLKIALLVDWSHTVKALPIREFLVSVQSARVDGLLIHALPPRLRQTYYETARLLGQPIVTTCYAASSSAVLDEAARHGSAYIYLAAHYGKTGSITPDYCALAPIISVLRHRAKVPIAIGFGIKDRNHLNTLREVGADAAIMGSAVVACVERAIHARSDVHKEMRDLLVTLGWPVPL